MKKNLSPRIRSNYLDNGTGNPWAGHRRVIAPPSIALNVCESAIVGNFGRALPIGSAEVNEFVFFSKQTNLNGKVLKSFYEWAINVITLMLVCDRFCDLSWVFFLIIVSE